MARAETIYEDHLFNTWLNYRKERDNKSRAEVIRDINIELNKQYTNSSFVDFLTFRKRIPNDFSRMINQDLAGMLEWLFLKKGWDKEKINFVELGKHLRGSNKKE